MLSITGLITNWTLISCIHIYATQYDIEPALINAIIHVESNHNPKAIGLVGEVGLMQIRPEYVPETSTQLADPCINIRRGVKLLHNARTYCKHKLDNTFLVCYNRGVTGGSKVQNPYNNTYYKKVMNGYKSHTK